MGLSFTPQLGQRQGVGSGLIQLQGPAGVGAGSEAINLSRPLMRSTCFGNGSLPLCHMGSEKERSNQATAKLEAGLLSGFVALDNW